MAPAEWNLTPDEIGDLKLKLPESARGGADMRVELVAADGAILASAVTRLDIAPDPRAALILRSDESGRIADLIAHGHKMIDVGYLAGARAYFKRAAEAGSGDAALLLGATFDPEFIDKIGAQGIRADPKEARGWYERAEQLGVKDAESKLKALKEDMTNRQQPVQATEASEVPANPAPRLAADEPAATAEEAVDQPGATEATSSPPEAEASLPAGQDEWVEVVSYANFRAAPSSNCGDAEGGRERYETACDRPEGELGSSHRSRHLRCRLGLRALYRDGAGAGALAHRLGEGTHRGEARRRRPQPVRTFQAR